MSPKASREAVEGCWRDFDCLIAYPHPTRTVICTIVILFAPGDHNNLDKNSNWETSTVAFKSVVPLINHPRSSPGRKTARLVQISGGKLSKQMLEWVGTFRKSFPLEAVHLEFVNRGETIFFIFTYLMRNVNRLCINCFGVAPISRSTGKSL